VDVTEGFIMRRLKFKSRAARVAAAGFGWPLAFLLAMLCMFWKGFIVPTGGAIIATAIAFFITLFDAPERFWQSIKNNL
jgi:hypothetical protein